jgi:hypothetical protein
MEDKDSENPFTMIAAAVKGNKEDFVSGLPQLVAIFENVSLHGPK